MTHPFTNRFVRRYRHAPRAIVLGLSLALVGSSTAFADPAEVVDVTATESASGWRFDVAILHPETGWDDYADGWRIEDAEGNILGTRPLAHPHANEQPFTRSISGVTVPEGLDQVMVRTRTNTEGWAETAAGPFTLTR